MTTTAATTDLTDLLSASGLPWHFNRWGVTTITVPDDQHKIRVSEDGGTFYLFVLSNGDAELIHTEARFSGIAAQALMLATLDALIAELA